MKAPLSSFPGCYAALGAVAATCVRSWDLPLLSFPDFFSWVLSTLRVSLLSVLPHLTVAITERVLEHMSACVENPELCALRCMHFAAPLLSHCQKGENSPQQKGASEVPKVNTAPSADEEPWGPRCLLLEPSWDSRGALAAAGRRSSLASGSTV